MAPNERAIREWIKTNRPDLTSDQVDSVFDNKAMLFIACMAFAAGCEFNQMNPDAGKFLTEPEESYNYSFTR